ncbi:uncharacterized protein (DUF58 family) [Frondihabitans sp. PhB188]|uniref:DUF58 domain-containing protein n=1 Tax=Frondihabitans sp. PhB188 TaxID=2485200 RepID=UPI000F477B3E|nr:DUF58 domain-containing protein [Frondihabitans sp. PhB188]ROQ41436.1 uncharacterized protein (DUF58 family) [Frondihabitans sp. PhB188]
MRRALAERARGWPRPTPRGLGAAVAGLAAAVVGYLLSSMPLVFAGVALIAVVVAALVSVGITMPELVIARRFSPDRAVAGWSVVETLSVSSPSSTGHVALRVRESVPWRSMHADEAMVAEIEPGRVVRLTFEHDDLPRGRHRVGPARIDVIESFGLARRHVEIVGRGELVVFPEIVGTGGGRESGALGEGARQRRDHSLAGGQDDPITREYRRGDPMRRVHWRATARQGELMVRQEEQHALPSVRVVLPVAKENWRDWHPALGSGDPVSDGFEWAVSLTASLALEYGMAGSQTRVVTLEGSSVGVHDPSTTPLFLERLADIALDDPVDDRSPDAAPREPVIAIVSSLTPGDLVRLGHARGPGVGGVAIVVHLDGDPLTPDDTDRDAPRHVAATLRQTGWRVVETDSAGDREAVLHAPGVLGG